MATLTAAADPQHGSGGVRLASTALVTFDAADASDSDIVVEWDFDNDGDFGGVGGDVTRYVLSLETVYGRDWPSQLTGRASPGRLRMTLRNDDDRFSHFNAASPLNAAPNSLSTGRKVRVRTVGAANPDPAVLARDRFRRNDGSLGTAEVGGAWTSRFPSALRIQNEGVLPTVSDFSAHMSTLDVAAVDYYVQVKLLVAGLPTIGIKQGSQTGLVYRFQDTTNYSLLVVTEAELRLVNVVAGVAATVAASPVEMYGGVTLGALVVGATVTAYLEGVAVLSAAAPQTDETEVGMFARWGVGGGLRGELDEFHVWAALPATVEGVLWTGDVSALSTSVVPGPKKLAVVEAEGRLSRMALQRTVAPGSGTATRALQSPTGRRTGLVVGNLIAQAQLLHPPGLVDLGDVTTAPFGREGTCLDVARDFEEAELGFLHETPEGYIGFDSRSARNAAVSQATFSDAHGALLSYSAVEPLDWRRELINQVIAELAPAAPAGVSLTTRAHHFFNATNPLNVLMPLTVDAGDLLLVAAAGSTGYATDPIVWSAPAGWTQLTTATNEEDGYLDGSRVFAKVAAGDEGNTRFTFATTTETDMGSAAVHVYRVTDWYGDLGGVTTSDRLVSSSDPPVILTGWGLEPSLFIAFRFGIRSSSASIAAASYPTGYTNGASTQATSGKPIHTAIQSARQVVVATLRDPGPFGGTFGPWSQRDVVTVAVRSHRGSPPGAGTVVQRDDVQSQTDHNAVKTHRDASDLLATEADVALYASLILAGYAHDRPILSLSFYASKSAAYRHQAVARRVSDKITLVANGPSGLGISADFFVESVDHRWSSGGKLWETTWQLSPA